MCLEKTMQEFFELIEQILHIGSLVSTFRSLKIRFLVEAEHARDDVGRETTNRSVIGSGRLVELTTSIGDGVFATFQLRLQVKIVLVGLQVGILLHRDQQA